MNRSPLDAGALLREFREILCLCPHCGEVHRLSDLHITARGPAKPTDLDRLDAEDAKLEAIEERLDLLEDKFRDAARAAGAMAAKKRLRRIDPVFSGTGLDPQDVKVVFDPIEYVTFRGLNRGEVREILLMAERPKSSGEEKVQESVASAAKKGNVEFATLRVSEAGEVVRG